MIFNNELLVTISDDDRVGEDILVSTGAEMPEVGTLEANDDPAQHVKYLLSEQRHKIELFYFVMKELGQVLSDLSEKDFPPHHSGDEDISQVFANRLGEYERRIGDFLKISVLITTWGDHEQKALIAQFFRRLPETCVLRSGLVAWLGLRWYPIMLLMYCTGMVAIRSKDFGSLRMAMLTEPEVGSSEIDGAPIISAVVEGMLAVDRSNLFKSLPGHEKNFVPRSEYVFKVLQPVMDDLLFLGSEYESLFDSFEILYALQYADYLNTTEQRFWGPPGRFAWKYKHRSNDPYTRLMREAQNEGESWGPIKAGLFGGSVERFQAAADDYEKSLNKLGWW